MKYIRDKNGNVYETVGESDYGYFVSCPNPDYRMSVHHDEIEREADSIEELCDEFVVFEESENNGFPLTCPKEAFDAFRKVVLFGMQRQLNCWLKGAIWTSRGLIYVAKMNEKGELELL